MAFTEYTKGSLLLNNSIQMEETEMSIKWENGAKPVHTVQKGLAGFSKGSAFITLSFKAAVPEDGPEYDDALQNMVDVEGIPVTAYIGQKTLTTTGVITAADFSHAVDTEAKFDYQITAVFNILQ
jgi:hypothetical protein